MKSKISLFLIIILIIVCVYVFKKSHLYSKLNYSKITDKWNEPIIFENFISDSEAKYIIDFGEKHFNESIILSGINKNIRSSKTAWLPVSDPICQKILKKVCDTVNLPIENCEPVQIVKYDKNGFYKEHHDSCCDKNDYCVNFINGGQRQITFLIYLNDEFEEGGTIFPLLNKTFKPKKNGAILFYPLATNTNMCHPKALHAGLPVKSGVKYIANVWIRENKYNKI